MLNSLRSVTARVPATTANLGPGFDCLGVALQLYNRVTVSRAARESSEPHPAMIAEAASAFFENARYEPPFAFEWTVEGDVPRPRHSVASWSRAAKNSFASRSRRSCTSCY